MAHHHTAHRAADALTELLKAHVSDGSHDVDIHDALAARDDIRELAYALEEPPEERFDIPEVGSIVMDTEHVRQFGDGRVRILEVSDDVARNHVCYQRNVTRPPPDGQGMPYNTQEDVTVAEENPSHPEDAPVVVAEYVEGSSKEYAFPVTRLEEL